MKNRFWLSLFVASLTLILAACGGGGGGGTDSGPITSAPTVTIKATTAITDCTCVVNADVNTGNLATSAWAVLATDNSFNSVVATTAPINLAAGTGTIAVTIPVSGLPDGTRLWAKVWSSNNKGTVGSGCDDFTTVTNRVTVNTTVHPAGSFVIFRNNQEVYRLDGNGSSYLPVAYTGPSGAYKFAVISNTFFGPAVALAVVDATDNVVFNLPPGANLTIGAAVSARLGRVVFNITGTGFSSTYRAPKNAAGTQWAEVTVVDNSTNPSAPVGTITNDNVTYTQNESQVTYTDPYIGTVTGTVMDDLLYFWKYTVNSGWSITWRKTLVLNSAATAFTGDANETWDAGGTSYYTHGTVTGTR